MLLSIIVAMDENRVIGRNGRLPWHLSTDLRRFKRLTMGHCLIMGRRTYDSIGRPLPGRVSIVITRNRQQVDSSKDLQFAGGLDEAVDLVATTDMDHDEAFVVGGAEIYRLALPCARRLYVTHVLADVGGNVVFPEIEASDWQLVESTRHDAGSGDEYDHVFAVHERVAK